jgi:hypothetical protein
VAITDRETGSNIALVSLGGVIGQKGFGRTVDTNIFTVTAGVMYYVLTPNPKRISAIIMNNGDAANPGAALAVYVGENNAGPFVLCEFGTFQIDSSFPWTGSVYVAYIGAFSPVVAIAEVSVQ